jgi:hypothetical protein
MHGIRSRTKLYNVIYTIFKPLYPFLRIAKTLATDTDKLGKAMITVAEKGYSKRILEMKDIYELSKAK